MKKEIKSLFKKNAGRSFKAKEIAKRLYIKDEYEYNALKGALHQLCEENFLSKNGKRFKVVTDFNNKLIGTLQVNRSGYGFVIVKNSNTGDIFIPERNLGTAFSGDTVEVSLFAKQKGRNIEGQIIDVVERKRKHIVGTLKRSNSFYVVKPDEQDIHRDIYISKESLNNAKTNDKVVVGDIVWSSALLNPEGKIVEVLGKSGSKEVEISVIAKEFNLPVKFPVNVEEEAADISGEISDNEIKKRLDLREKNIVTIDPADAKDFDDAVSIEKTENGNYLVGIHIADVSHYVSQNSSLDKEAEQRGNSVYLVGKVIPMLPEKLSNNICSLVPNQDRLTYSVLVELTSRGKIISHKILKTIINSKRRFTYEEAQEIIETRKGDYAEDILLLNKLAVMLRKKRMREGSINFTSTEVRFELDENNQPVKILLKELKESNMLIEEFMLLANQVVAKHIYAVPENEVKPFVYRIHDLPDREKLVEFARFVKSLGYSFDVSAGNKPKQFQKLLEDVKGKEEEAVINDLAIRSLAKAVYSPNNIGHYGLGFKYYSHFTSPIRRYADLIVHRLLFNYIEGNRKPLLTLKKLDAVCNHISYSERNAIEAERLSVKLKQIEYLKNHVGDEFHAVVSGVTNFGLFVKLTDNLAEGLIKMKDLEGDYYVYDEKKYALVGKRTKRTFRLGDKVNVKLIRVDIEKKEVDFLIANEFIGV